MNLGSQYISQDLGISGNGTIAINWQPNTVAQARTIALVE
jgi:hypothetical protein